MVQDLTVSAALIYKSSPEYRDRVDREVIGYQSGISWVEVGKIVLIVMRSGISRALVG